MAGRGKEIMVAQNFVATQFVDKHNSFGAKIENSLNMTRYIIWDTDAEPSTYKNLTAFLYSNILSIQTCFVIINGDFRFFWDV